MDEMLNTKCYVQELRASKADNDIDTENRIFVPPAITPKQRSFDSMTIESPMMENLYASDYDLNRAEDKEKLRNKFGGGWKITTNVSYAKHYNP